jgi:hypothetical protein
LAAGWSSVEKTRVLQGCQAQRPGRGSRRLNHQQDRTQVGPPPRPRPIAQCCSGGPALFELISGSINRKPRSAWSWSAQQELDSVPVFLSCGSGMEQYARAGLKILVRARTPALAIKPAQSTLQESQQQLLEILNF